MCRLQYSFEPYPGPKNIPLWSQKVKNYPKIKSDSKVRSEGIIENKSCSTAWVDLKTVLEPYTPTPKIAQKITTTPKLSQNQKYELKET